MPQEIEVWYLIPALRRELAKRMIKDYKLSQKKVAEYLGITESAISQYLKSKRGKEIKFTENQKSEIKKVASNIIEKNSDIMKELYDLCILFRRSKVMCNLHKLHDKRIPKNCEICFQDN